jgi:hypothetical protein
MPTRSLLGSTIARHSRMLMHRDRVGTLRLAHPTRCYRRCDRAVGRQRYRVRQQKSARVPFQDFPNASPGQVLIAVPSSDGWGHSLC